MATVPSAKNQDPTLHFVCIGGPRDGFKSGDLPAHLSGQPLTGMVYRTPMSTPHEFSLHAVYECVGDAQVDGFWQFFFQAMEGPNGERLVALADPTVTVWPEEVERAAQQLSMLGVQT